MQAAALAVIAAWVGRRLATGGLRGARRGVLGLFLGQLVSTGLLTALAVIATVVTHPDLLALHGADPEGFTGFLRNLLLFEPDSRLYLLGADGTVLASSGDMPLAPGLKVTRRPALARACPSTDCAGA